ncbi:MAG TPA: hypothetical protein DCM08_01710, partial [Microscillaceae bacterium]|nr:hypothetical protein [Microscillaceae bacterium]
CLAMSKSPSSYFLQLLLTTVIALFCAHANFAQTFAPNSVLAEGRWWKLGVVETSIHKIDAAFLRTLGVNPAEIDPRTIRLMGNGGGMLPQANNAPRLDDLVENAIWVSGEADGRFDPDDFILFYAQSADAWTFNPVSRLFEHQKNLYADTNYYFLQIGTTQGLRISTQPLLAPTPQNITTFDDYLFYEAETRSILRSGRQWYGEAFETNLSQNFTFRIEGIAAGTNATLTAALMASGSQPSNFAVSIGNTPLGNVAIPAIPQGTFDVKGAEALQSFTFNTLSLSSSANPVVNLTYNRAGGSVGFLNYLRLNFRRNLQLYGNQTAFRSVESLGFPQVNYVIQNVDANTLIWEITNPLRPTNQPLNLSGSTAQFTATSATLKQFIALSGNNFRAPIAVGSIPNQNLHALGTPTMLILTSRKLLSEAQRLANFKNQSGISTQVALVEEIYNEFSSGRQDISALRDFIRMLYLRNPASLRYVLLFGGASYDYKFRLRNNTNLVPTYESFESLHPIFSFSSDDYFGFMEATEGNWVETSAGDHTLELGIGRLPVAKVEEAAAIVDKIIRYSSPQALGDWRNRVCFVADDGDFNIHQQDADFLANKIVNNYPNYLVDKLLLDAFKQVSSPTGEKSPALSEALNREINEGALIVNYTGHGGEVGWAEEDLLNIPQIRNWTNSHRLPLFVTATCEFGRYDNPDIFSGGQVALATPNGGAIALITTTRPVFSNTNFLLNNAFYDVCFEPIQGQMPRLGDLQRLTKNNSLNGAVNRNFVLFGDPSLQLAYPQHRVVATRLNGKDLLTNPDTLKASAKVRIEGEVRDLNGNKLTQFNGVMQATIFDKRQTFTTLGNKNQPFTYEQQNNALFRGAVSVRNGNFSVEFRMPRNINFVVGQGKWNFYAQNPQANIDAQGSQVSIRVGGTSATLPTDNQPPDIQLFMDDEAFKTGGLVGSNALLIAKLRDENGINISTAGIGQDITSLLDNNLTDIRILNDFYSADLDSYQSGEVRYPYQNLSPGVHRIKVKAWDNFNNSAEKTVEFFVGQDARLLLKDVLNYPNPLADQTTFRFDHNRKGQDLLVVIQIF